MDDNDVVETKLVDSMTTVNNLQCSGYNLLRINGGEKYAMVNSENGTGDELNDPVEQFAQHLLEEDPDDVDMRTPYCMSNDNLAKFTADVAESETDDDHYYDYETFVRSLVPGLKGLIENASKIAAFHKLNKPRNLDSLYVPCSNDQCWGSAVLKCTAKRRPILPVLRNPSVYEPLEPFEISRKKAREYLSKLEGAIKSETGKVCGVCAVYSFFGTDSDENNRNIGWFAFPAVHRYFFRSYSTHNLPFGDILSKMTIDDYRDGAYCLRINGETYI